MFADGLCYGTLPKGDPREFWMDAPFACEPFESRLVARGQTHAPRSWQSQEVVFLCLVVALCYVHQEVIVAPGVGRSQAMWFSRNFMARGRYAKAPPQVLLHAPVLGGSKKTVLRLSTRTEGILPEHVTECTP